MSNAGNLSNFASNVNANSDAVVGVVTATLYSGDGTGLTGAGLGTTGSVNTSGIITASVYYGDGSNLDGVSIGSTGSVNTTGVITATKFVGDGSGITNIGGGLSVVTFTPSNGATGIALTTNIVVKFNKVIKAGVGTIQLKEGNEQYSYTTTAADSSNYTVSGTDRNGSVSGTDPTITIKVGDTITFDNSSTYSAHPMYIRVSDGGASVSNPPASGEGTATVSWTPSETGTYYYQCGNHAAMIGQIVVQDIVVEEFNVGTSSSITFSAGELTINPTSNLGYGTTYFPVLPAGVISDVVGLSSNTTIDTYNFTTIDLIQPLFAWGFNSSGQLAQNNRLDYSSPVQIPGTQWSLIRCGYDSSLAIKTDGTLWAWGSNSNGRLGQNNLTQYSSPVQIPGNSWSSDEGKLKANGKQSAAIKTDGTLWVWGYALDGGLAQNNLTQYSSPVQIPGNTWNKIGAGRDEIYASKTDGTLWVWGGNDNGQLGQNNKTAYSSPVQIPGTSWTGDIDGGFQHKHAIKSDGTLWAWGNNYAGRLGQNNTTYYSSPVQIPGTQWSSISSSNYAVLAIKTDNTLWACGSNSSGTIGQNNRTQYSSPVQIPGTSWSSIGNFARHGSFGIKTDGTLWAWGNGNTGGLGQNDIIYYSSPVQIPGTQWSSLGSDGNYLMFAIKSE